MSINPAYSQLILLDSTPSRIQTICSSEQFLFVGTIDGQILSYQLVYGYQDDPEDFENFDPDTSSPKPQKKILQGADLSRKKQLGHGKKSVTMLELIGDLQLLLSLCDGHLTVLHMDSLENAMPNFQLKDTQGFCIDKKNSHRLLVRYKKDFMFYIYKPQVGFDLEHRFYLPQELVKPISVEWYDNTLYLGLKKSYVMVDIRKPSEYHELLTHKEPDPLVTFLPPNLILLRQSSHATLIPVSSDQPASPPPGAGGGASTAGGGMSGGGTTAGPVGGVSPSSFLPFTGWSITPTSVTTSVTSVATTVASTVYNTTTNFFTATLSTIPAIVGSSSSTLTPPPPSLTALIKTLNWPSNLPPSLLSFEFPYLLSVQNTSLTIQNILTQKCIQLLSFNNTVVSMQMMVRDVDALAQTEDYFNTLLYNSNNSGNKKQIAIPSFGRIVMTATGSRVYVLNPISIEKQVQKMFEMGQIQEGVELFRSVNVQADLKVFDNQLKVLYAKAGIASFCALNFEKAFSYFDKSDINACEVISFFDNLLPSQLHYVPKYHPQQSFKDILSKTRKSFTNTPVASTSGNARGSSQEEALTIQYYQKVLQQLIDFLIKKRNPVKKTNEQIGIDTALAKLYADLGKWKELREFLGSLTQISAKDTELYYEQKGYTYALGCLAKSVNDENRALELWNKLVTSSLFEESSTAPDGMNDSISLLSYTTNIDLIWMYGPTLFKKSGQAALKIFTKNEHPELTPDRVLQFLESSGIDHSEELQEKYLEHLVQRDPPPDPQYFTKLGLMYIHIIVTLLPKDQQSPIPITQMTSTNVEEIKKPGSEPGILGQTRRKFIDFLRKYNQYNCAAFLTRIGENPLYPEAVFLNRKLAQHHQALSILLFKSQDLKGAEEYCLSYSDPSSDTGKKPNRTNFVITSPNLLFNVSPSGPRGTIQSPSNKQPMGRVRTDQNLQARQFAQPQLNQRRERKITTDPSLSSSPTLTTSMSSSSISVSSNQEEAPSTDVSEVLFIMFDLLVTAHLKNYPGQLAPAALQLLRNHPFLMPTIKVVSSLPDEIPISSISEFLTRSIQHKTHTLRSGQIVKNLYKFEYLKVSAIYTSVRSRSVMITKETECRVCKKFINDKIFSTYPNGVIVHYKCCDDPKVDPITRRNFKQKPLF